MTTSAPPPSKLDTPMIAIVEYRRQPVTTDSAEADPAKPFSLHVVDARCRAWRRLGPYCWHTRQPVNRSEQTRRTPPSFIRV